MGLSGTAAEMIIQEHQYRPLAGRVLLIGRQNTDIVARHMTALLGLYGLEPKIPYVLEKPGAMAHHIKIDLEDRPITDVSVFHALAPDVEVSAIDVSDYEGAEIIHDLSHPIPDEIKGKFDFIYDGSTLDNVWNGPQVMMNMTQLLAPRGRIIMWNASNSTPTAYAMFPPDWFIDYFAINNYADCKVYVGNYPVRHTLIPSQADLPPQSGDIWHFDPLVVYSGQQGYQWSQIEVQTCRYVYCIAEKGEASTWNRTPVQMHYRGAATAEYLAAAERFQRSPRPIFHPRSGVPLDVKNISGYPEIMTPLRRYSEPL